METTGFSLGIHSVGPFIQPDPPVGGTIDPAARDPPARRHGLGKSIPPAFPYSKHPEARRRASHAPVGANEIGRNPSTALPSLLEAILQDSPES